LVYVSTFFYNDKDAVIMKIKYLIFLFFGLISKPAFSQETPETLKYEIVVMGMKIGDVIAKRGPGISDTVDYKLDSRVKFWFFGNVDLQFATKTQFVEEKIVKTNSQSKTNRGDYLSSVVWTGSQYKVDAVSYKYENQNPVKGPLSWCGTRLFFQEPKPGDVFLSEVYGVSQKIIQIEPEVYEISVGGNKNRYYYKSGELEKIVIENPIKNYQVRRVR
jgi:hypothetical protein